ncbi:DEAD/DEAH box helicase, putative [Entamoeba histolytica HM-1:IMSS-B]|uniref:DEAD/DEAH box helicase, putative n=6 Tax=Entamoeba histolytica TaxID=5759 RepID=C4M435_ENTH1|nr:DEAD/DEAH box helicase, putative [Entamoeba histolytica HM-1:IMSS]EMD48682.1 ATP-dependent RNA helicase, putative [Entamoeba histolytica KU27]EMH74873.1 DEAD/DEAH box helicase, putative [Entamoeba histolytica HM-1:IMSS-B]EMS12519.1 ATP-dependent RNA helicase [Entamoeba histolytica HM-3:IMSS]ENY62167.1 ATP-dependent RNA helicase, putative [Entamoeba histolytica HM-1:IMSS-A]GAT96109.1 dead deah box helicase putative [Entamoeba histolytica]|eukprot:XP_650643.1 DEAD/DEAH box helicase, putative [Entamoeba histolytica HM-1:IMSS]
MSKGEENELPIMKYKEQIIKCVKENQITILLGDTGCGKTTMVSQLLYDNSIPCVNPSIVTTNPRKIGAESVAERVAALRMCELGKEVGYKVRFDNHTSKETKLYYVTDGVLLTEISNDFVLKKYDILIIDEAHERSINTDFLIAYSSRLITQRKDMRVIISSATINTNQLEEYYKKVGCSVGRINVIGKPYNVEMKWGEGKPSSTLNQVVDCIISIHCKQEKGDVLVFLPGSEEIEKCCSLLAEKATEITANYDLIILPLYSALPLYKQKRVFFKTPEHARKIVISTNIAETSITVPGIKYVIDQGLVKVLRSSNGAEGLSLETISRAEAVQRAGRAGRTSNGICIRLYSEEAFNNMKNESTPEITRVNLEGVVLKLKYLNISLDETFFLEDPPIYSVVDALKELYCIKAIDENGHITQLGIMISKIPLPPRAAVVLYYSYLGHSLEIISPVLAMLNQESLFTKSFQMKSYSHEDLISLFITYQLNKKRSDEWLHSIGINPQMMKASEQVSAQLIQMAEECFGQNKTSTTDTFRDIMLRSPKEIKRSRSHSRHSHHRHYHFSSHNPFSEEEKASHSLTIKQRRDDSRIEIKQKSEKDEINELLIKFNTKQIIECFYEGYWRNTAKRTSTGQYNIKNTQILGYIHPTSCCYDIQDAEYVFYISLSFTTAIFLRWVNRVDELMVNNKFLKQTPTDIKQLIGEKLSDKLQKEKQLKITPIRETAHINVKRMEVKKATSNQISEAKKRYFERKMKKEINSK